MVCKASSRVHDALSKSKMSIDAHMAGKTREGVHLCVPTDCCLGEKCYPGTPDGAKNTQATLS